MTIQEFELGYRRPWGPWVVAIDVAVTVGISIWLFVTIPHDLFTLVMATAFVAFMFALSGWDLYRRSRPQQVRFDETGIVIGLHGKERLRWGDIEAVDLFTYEIGNGLSRKMLNFAFQPGARGQIVQIRLKERRGIWNALRGHLGSTAFRFGRTVDLPVIGAARFVEVAREYLGQNRLQSE